MRIVSVEEWQNAVLKPILKGVKPVNKTTKFRLTVYLNPEEADTTIQPALAISDENPDDDNSAEKGNVKYFEFDDCFPFDEIPDGGINLREWSKQFAPLEAFQNGIEALLTPEAKLTIELQDEMDKDDKDDDPLVFLELIIRHFITHAAVPLSELDGLLELTETHAAA